MVSPLEFCPKCQGFQNTILSLGLRKSIRKVGYEGEDILFHFHCRSCNAYIRSYPMIAESEEPDTIEIPQYALLGEEQRVPA